MVFILKNKWMWAFIYNKKSEKLSQNCVCVNCYAYSACEQAK